MRTMVLVLIAAAAVQDPPAPKFTTEFKLAIEQAGGEWKFVIEGTTNLPDGAVLKGRLFAVEEVDDFKGGKRVDEEPLIQEGRGFRLIKLKGGKIKETLLASPRKPYSIWYRARLTYDPDIQDNPILDKAGEAEMKWGSDLHPGTPKDFERELAETLKGLTREMEEVQSLYRDLRGKFQVWTRAPDPAAFAEWRKGFAVKVAAIRKTNDSRYSIWVVWLERQAKFRFESFCDRLDGLCIEFDEWLGLKKKIADLSKNPGKQAEALKELTDEEQDHQLRIMYGLTGFLAYFEEAREALGIDTPSDPDVVDAILKDYEAATGELAALASKGDAAAWKERAPAARARARAALMKLSTPSLMPRRAYDRVLELADKFAQLHSILEKTASGEKVPPNEAAAEHAALVAEFRKYAGAK
jgi:hypothetical protein